MYYDYDKACHMRLYIILVLMTRLTEFCHVHVNVMESLGSLAKQHDKHIMCNISKVSRTTWTNGSRVYINSQDAVEQLAQLQVS